MEKQPKNPERSFGLSVGFVLCAIAAVLWWRGRVGRAEILAGVGSVLVICGACAPRLLKYPSAAWWRLARVLGHVNSRVLLTVFFGIVLVPVSLVWRMTAKDPLARGRHAFPGWTAYPSRYRDRKHYQRMY